MPETPTDSSPRAPLWLLGLLFLAWQLPGVIGRSPWKSDEAYTMGLVHHVLESGDLIVPELGGEPFMQKPTLFFVTAAGFAKVLAPVFAPHVGARMASILFNLVTLLFAGLTARELNGRGRGWAAPVLFMACIGPLHMSHFILTDLALLAGISLALYGMVLGRRRSWAGGLLCGTGAGLAFMAKGLLGAGLPGLAVLLLPVCDRAWRNAGWLRFTGACVLAALPWATVWPVLLFARSPQLFSEWFVDNNFGRFHPGIATWLMARLEEVARALGRLGEHEHLVYHNVNGPKGTRGYMFVLLAWYAFPASAFAAWTVWREGWRAAPLRVPLVFLGAGLLVFTASRDGREIYALPLVVPFLIVGARAFDGLSPVALRRIQRVAVIVFSAGAVLAWAVWIASVAGGPVWIMDRFARRLPGFVPSFRAVGFGAAIALTLFWGLLLRRARPESVPVQLGGGIALLYGLGMTLFLPAAEWQMSYERQFAPLRSAIPAGAGPVLSRGLGEPQRAMLDYYAGWKTLRLERKENRQIEADWMLTQSDYPSDKHHPGADWERVWQDRHEGEWFQLFRRIRH